MPLTASAIRRGTAHRVRDLERRCGDDIRQMRVDAGISLAELGMATGHDPTYLGRIERGLAHPSLAVLVSIGVALGSDLSLRYFPGGGLRIRDRFQAPMVETLLEVLHARWRPDLEVRVSDPARGVIDVVLTARDTGLAIATEVQSELRRLEQLIRWSAEKADGLITRPTAAGAAPPTAVSKLLIVRSTVDTRAIASRFERTLATAYPARTADVVTALTTPDAPWPGSGIAWMHVHGQTASLMRHPPPGVRLGR